MKNKFYLVLAVAFVASTSEAVFASPQTIEGVVSESMCGKKHMLPGKTDAQCTKECVKANSKYTLVVGDKLYTLSGPVNDFEKYAGKKVRVNGDVSKDAILVTTIGEASR